MILVVADDITGAAEIAGIAHSHGLHTILTTSAPSDCGGADVVVIATDARSYPAEEAARLTREAVSGITIGEDVMLFRKTDSALRGNVREELEALGGNFVYMPANPSKGRIIRDGVYYIGDTPLHETDFRFDPEFPAWSSVVSERFPGVEYANAESRADVDRVVEEALSHGKRLAGAADLFCSLIETTKTKTKTETTFNLPPFNGRAGEGLSRLIVCGSTQSKALDLGYAVESMPLDVFYEESAPCTWVATIIDRYRRNMTEGAPENRGVILTIGDKEVRKGKAAAVYLRKAMAEVCCALLAAYEPTELIIEGGATAYAILSQTPYTTFEVTDEIAPGVVRLRPLSSTIHITMKPGSYPWGGLFE